MHLNLGWKFNMKNTLISWGEVLERYEISHQELVQLCNEGLQVFDKNKNKIFATSQCKPIPIEPPVVTWGRIIFDMEQDELIFDKDLIINTEQDKFIFGKNLTADIKEDELPLYKDVIAYLEEDKVTFDNNVLESKLFKITFFPKTGDFVVVRKDIPPKIYDQNILAHLLNVDFPKELTHDFFKKIHKAGDESYLPTDAVKKENSLTGPITLRKKNAPTKNENIKMFETTIGIVKTSSQKQEKELRIPYILRQKHNLSEKKNYINLKLGKHNHSNKLYSSKKSSKIKITIREAVNTVTDLTNIKNYYHSLNNRTLTIEYKNLQPLYLTINGKTFIAPHIKFFSDNFSGYPLPPIHDEKYETEFYNLCSEFGNLSYIPTKFKLPEKTASEETVYHFQKCISPISNENLDYNEEEVIRVKNNFFFQQEDLSARQITQKPINLKNKLFIILDNFCRDTISTKEQNSLKVAKIKFESNKGHIEIFDEVYPSEVHKKDGSKQTKISRDLKAAHSLLEKFFLTFPKSKKDWLAYQEDPIKYLNQDEIFKNTPTK